MALDTSLRQGPLQHPHLHGSCLGGGYEDSASGCPCACAGWGGMGGAGAGRRECAGAVVIAPAFLASAPDRRSAHRGLPVMCLTGSRQDLHRLCTQTQVMGIC